MFLRLGPVSSSSRGAPPRNRPRNLPHRFAPLRPQPARVVCSAAPFSRHFRSLKHRLASSCDDTRLNVGERTPRKRVKVSLCLRYTTPSPISSFTTSCTARSSARNLCINHMYSAVHHVTPSKLFRTSRQHHPRGSSAVAPSPTLHITSSHVHFSHGRSDSCRTHRVLGITAQQLPPLLPSRFSARPGNS